MKEIFSLVAALVAVAFVIYLSYLFSRYISMGSSKINRTKHMKVIDRLIVGQDRSILIISVQDKVLLISVTPQSIQILKELESHDFEDVLSQDPKGRSENSFKTVLQNILKQKR